MSFSAPSLKPTTGHRFLTAPPPARHRGPSAAVPPRRSTAPPIYAVAGKQEKAATETKISPAAERLSRRAVVLAAVAAALAWDGGREEAAALGPEGPLVEEFWDNVRRYGLYALTVSTGAIYSILQPFVELMRNPFSALLLLLLLGGSFYLLSQVLTFMVGINDFSYDYAP